MIAYLLGKPILQSSGLIMLVQGVGYGVMVSAKTLIALAARAEESKVELWIYTHVREEALDLYGFLKPEDKSIFQILLSVSGVGPRTALGIIEAGASAIIDAVQTANVAFFSSVPRVGKKLAQKIIIELKPKLGSLQELNLGPQNPQAADVTEALLALGFSDQEVQMVTQNLDFSGEFQSAYLIKQAIKLIGARK